MIKPLPISLLILMLITVLTGCGGEPITEANILGKWSIVSRKQANGIPLDFEVYMVIEYTANEKFTEHEIAPKRTYKILSKNAVDKTKIIYNYVIDQDNSGLRKEEFTLVDGQLTVESSTGIMTLKRK